MASNRNYKYTHYPLVKHLRYLADSVNTVSASRAELAELRRGLADPIRIAIYVERYIPEDTNDRDSYYLIAGLFAWHKSHQDNRSLGNAFGEMKDKSDSMEKRFFALLSAPKDMLDSRLGQAIRILASKGESLDWNRLLDDVLHWEDIKGGRQRQLARDYYYNKDDKYSTYDTNQENLDLK